MILVVIHCLCNSDQIGFSRFSQEFLNSKVDGDLLLQLSEKSLSEDIGIANGILRKRFQRELNQLKRLADYSSCDTSGLSSFLQGLGPEFCQYTYQMLLSGVHVKDLRELTPEQLETECGISNSIHRMRIMHMVKGEGNPHLLKMRNDCICFRLAC
ncbi:Sterile alpha and TIR motif-containing protein 1 [Araneus ventricosus]|uniref:Sterile alpha and TIR motif-containing protein 1 n=1 Tax=Araneus ventricosus TaxID=182803 RepID=A0A4Y2XAD8_ARAVE|nr:Sterile alpha and TIR motif-containing protein 1 [Araneus ventricosus]